MRTILWFDQISLHDVQLVGGKGANLGELTSAHLPVPPGFVVTSEVYLAAIDASGVRVQLEDIVRTVDANDPAALAAASARCTALFRQTPDPRRARGGHPRRLSPARRGNVRCCAVLGHERGRRRHVLRWHERHLHQRHR